MAGFRKLAGKWQKKTITFGMARIIFNWQVSKWFQII